MVIIIQLTVSDGSLWSLYFHTSMLVMNDWAVSTGSPLYLQEIEFFSYDEFVAADGFI
jgi:hypothetical protein